MSRWVVCVLTLFVFASCVKELAVDKPQTDPQTETALLTRAVPVQTFDWETVDFMPTPPGQPRISPPWIGQGSLTSTYGIDVVYDHKKSDGWVLLYSTFSTSGPQIANPYFILYNKYRGIMRIYSYVTTPFAVSSSYLQDGITVVGSTPRSLLSYLGEEIVDVNDKPSSYMQMQGAPTDGSAPFASNKWYMLQYELAYDPTIANTNYNAVQFSWMMNYINVTKIELGGELTGRLYGTIGSSSNPSIFSPLASTLGQGAIAVIGSKVLANNQIDSTGKNEWGLPANTYKAAVTGVDKAISNLASSFPQQLVSLFSALIGGSRSGPTPISLNLDTKIKLEGSATNSGSFPSSPTSLWVPGSVFTSSTQGYIPSYNKPLGVVYISSKPTITIPRTIRHTEYLDSGYQVMWETWEYIYRHPQSFDFSSYLLINPEVLKVADVRILKQDLVMETYNGKELNLTYLQTGPHYSREDQDYQRTAIRFTIRVTPKDGGAPTDIYKSFELRDVYTDTWEEMSRFARKIDIDNYKKRNGYENNN